MARTTKTPTPEATTNAANPPVTFSAEELQRVIAQATAAAVAEATASLKAEMQAALAAKTPAINGSGKSDQSRKNELATIKAFKAKGFGVVTPNVDVFTFRRWVDQGFRPVEGSKSVKVSNLRLFHRSQVRQLSVEEIQAMQAQSDAAVARRMADVIPIGEANPQ
jgi:hypothetical protein